MTMSDNADGAAVRRAIDGPDIDHDELISFIAARNQEDGDRASDAGESRQAIGEFVERTGMNAKALAWMRQILKANNKSQAKAMDIILSVEKALPMIKAHVAGQGTPDMFPEDESPADVAPPTTSGDADFDAEINALFPEAAE
jgi:hypothetical protein